MKNIIIHFIKYPLAGWILVFGIVSLGVLGALNMRSSFFPLNESRMINISVMYPGASPQEMEEGIVLKIEDNLRGLVGVDRFTSTSSENSARIMVEVLKGYNVDAVLQEVKNAVDRVPSYPVGMEPPVIAKSIFRTEAVSMVITGDNVSLKSLKQIAREVETDLRNMEGISQVEVSGYPREEIEITVDETLLRAFNLTFRDVANAVSNNNILMTGGSIKTAAEEYLIRVSNRSYYGDELDYLVVKAQPNGNKVYLKDVASVRDRWNENPERSYYNSRPAVNIEVHATNSEDLLNVSAMTLEYVENFNASRNNLELVVVRDAAQTVRERTMLLAQNAVMGIILVLVFLALFLKPRLAFWVAFGLPISFFGMFIFADMLHVTINVLSLFGMIIVIGILVDDGIVIAENIYNHYEKGKKPIRAAIDGTIEVIPPITSAIITTLIAFSTFYFLDGRIGEFFSEVSTIVMLTLAVSLVEALTILPAHVGHSNALSPNQKTYVFNRYADKFMSLLRDKLYAPYIKFFLRHEFLGLAIPVTLLLITLGAMNGGLIKNTFFPTVASDRITITLKMPQGTNELVTDSLIQIIEKSVWEVNEVYTKKQEGGKQVVESVIRNVGPGTSTATLRVNLLPGEERSFEATQIAASISDQVGEVPGAESVEFGSGGSFGGKPVSVSLTSTNIAELKGAKEILKQRLRENVLLKDVSDNDPQGIKEIKLTLKESAYALGFQLSDLIRQVRSGFFGMEVQRFQRGRDEIRVWVRYAREERSSIKNLDDMRVISPNGQRVPLSEIANYKIERGEISINHIDGRREITVSADLKDPKNSATEIMEDVQREVMPEINIHFPTVTANFEGQNREAGKVTGSAGKVLPIVILLIYIMIAFTFRSLVQPLMLMIMVPFSLIGVAWGHYIHGLPINMLSFLGIIALIGIVVNDGLVLIEKFNGFLREGYKFNDALLEAGKSRFRAIFLTSATTIAGLAPLIFEKSRQAKFLIPMAVSIAYGIALATMLTLVMLPILLSLGNWIKLYVIWLFTGKKPERESLEQAIIEQKAEEHDLYE